MKHDVTPLRQAGYVVEGSGLSGYRATAPDDTVWTGSNAEVVAAALTHMGLPTGHDGDLLVATVAVRGDGGVMVDRRFAGAATMAKVDDWGSTERVRVLHEPDGTYRWDASLPPSHSGIGYYFRWFGLTGRWEGDLVAQHEAGWGDPMAPVFRTRRSRGTGLVTHARCGQAIGTVVRRGTYWGWATQPTGGARDIVRTMREGTNALLRLHLPECPQCPHSAGQMR